MTGRILLTKGIELTGNYRRINFHFLVFYETCTAASDPVAAQAQTINLWRLVFSPT